MVENVFRYNIILAIKACDGPLEDKVVVFYKKNVSQKLNSVKKTVLLDLDTNRVLPSVKIVIAEFHLADKKWPNSNWPNNCSGGMSE